MVTLVFVLVFTLLWGVFAALLPPLRHGVAFAANRTARLRYSDYLPVLALVIVGGAVALWAGEEFLDLAELVHDRNTSLQQIDQFVHDWAVSQRSPGATPFFVTMSVIGSPGVLAAILILLGAVLLMKRRYRWFLYLAGTTGLGALLNLALKSYFARARPDLAERLRDAAGYSFPSGHAMGSTIVIGALTYLALRVLQRWSLKAGALALGVTLVVAISSSRIYLGVHWISDIGAGITAGLIWLTSTTVAYEASRRIRLVRAIRVQKSQSHA